MYAAQSTHIFFYLSFYVFCLYSYIYKIEIPIISTTVCQCQGIYFSHDPSGILGRAQGTVIYRDRQQYRKSQTVPGVIVFRFDGAIFFGNTNYLREQLKQAELDKQHGMGL